MFYVPEQLNEHLNVQALLLHINVNVQDPAAYTLTLMCTFGRGLSGTKTGAGLGLFFGLRFAPNLVPKMGRGRESRMSVF